MVNVIAAKVSGAGLAVLGCTLLTATAAAAAASPVAPGQIFLGQVDGSIAAANLAVSALAR